MGGFRYVDDFEFPAEAGFTGSAGQTHVRGYARGGAVKPVEPAAAPKAKTGKMSPASPTHRIPPPMRKAEGGLAVKRKGVPVASAKPIIERTPPKPMAVNRRSPEAGDTDARVGRDTATKPVIPGRDNYAKGGKVEKKGLGGVIGTLAPLLGGVLGMGLANSLKKKKKQQDQGPPPPVNAAQALAQRTAQPAASTTDDPNAGMKKGGRVKC